MSINGMVDFFAWYVLVPVNQSGRASWVLLMLHEPHKASGIPMGSVLTYVVNLTLDVAVWSVGSIEVGSEVLWFLFPEIVLVIGVFLRIDPSQHYPSETLLLLGFTDSMLNGFLHYFVGRAR